jgi:hypothetical protein
MTKIQLKAKNYKLVFKGFFCVFTLIFFVIIRLAESHFDILINIKYY